jgi:RHS repeat-associated protein
VKKLLHQLSLAFGLSLFVALACQAATGNDNPTGVTGDYNGNITTGGSYDPYTGNAKRFVTDLTVTGSVGSYPLKWTRVLNTRNGFASAQLGQGGTWRHSYQWGLWIRPLTAETGNNNYDGPWGAVSYPDGRTMELRCETPYEYSQASGFEPMDRLVHTGNGNFDLIMQDGGRVTFQHGAGSTSGSYSLTATQIVDPYGQTTLLSYDSAGRLSTVTEPGGRYLQITYYTYSYSNTWNGNTYNYSVDMISKVEAFAGPGQLTETVNYSYTMEYVGVLRYFNLTQVNYDDGTQASYTYYPSLAATMVSGRIHTCDDVRFAGAMSRIEYEYATPEENSGGAVGQIKREKNLTTHQTVSEVFYPPGSCCAPWYDPTPYQRTETRPDGATRYFQYGLGNGELESYTDFKNQRSYIDYGGAPSGYARIVTDALGHATSTEKEWVAGAVMAVNHPDGSSIHYTYSDAANPYYMASRTDERGNTTSYLRDGSNRITRTDYPDLSYETFSYNSFGLVLTHLLTSGGTETLTYDTRGLKTTSYPSPTESDPDPWNHPTRYNYYQSGPNTDRLLNVIDPHGNATWYEYNLRGEVTKLTHQDGSYVQSAYNLDGTLASVTDELGHTTTYTYDEYKRVLTVTNPLNQTATNCYEPWSGIGSLSHTTSSVYWSTSPTGKMSHFNYDENFRRITLRQAPGTADDAWTYYGYDAVGNLSWTQDPRGYTTTFGYDNRNRQISATNPLSEVNQTEYDFASNKKKEIRPDNSFQRWEYDTMNRVSDAYGFANEHTHYDRNTTGTVRSITDAKGAVYTFYYDGLNRKVSEWYPADEAGGGSRYEHWYYDWAGNNYRYDNPAGMVKCFEHDSRNRIWHSYWWGNIGQDIVTHYDVASRVSDITTNWGETVIAYGYDNANRKVWEDQTQAGQPTRRVETPRDGDGNRSALQVGSQYYIGYTYTQRNQLASIGGVCNFSYDASGNMTQRNGVLWYGNAANFEYDALNRVTQIEQGGNGWIFARNHYQYDSLGRDVAEWRDEDGGKGERYGYTTTNQLSSAVYMADQVYSGNPLNAQSSSSYTYTPDTLNRQSVNDNGAVTNYTANGMNQYTDITGQGLHYDGNFNIWYLNGGYVTYDADKRVTSVSVGGSEWMHFTYDGLGRCVRRMEMGTTTLFTYDEWNQMLEWDEWGNFKAWNIYGARADEILARYDTTNGALIYKQDKLGNVVFLLDGSGNLRERYRYDAFGAPTVTDWYGNTHGGASWYGNRFLFTGREYLAWIACYDYRNRMYRPSLGRFLQTDPTGFDAGDMNLFRYCADDPVDRSDPTGLIDSNNFDPNTPDYTWAQRADLRKFSDLYSYGAHGGDHDYNYGQALNPAYRSTGQPIRLNTVIASIKGNPIFQHRSGTLLIVCNSGADRSTFARSVAMGTGKDVLAPNKYLWLLDQKDHPFVVAGGYRDSRTGELKMNKNDPGHLTRFHPDGSSKAGADYNISARDANGAQLAAGGGENSGRNTDYSRQLDQSISNYEMGVGDNSGEGFHPRGPR